MSSVIRMQIVISKYVYDSINVSVIGMQIVISKYVNDSNGLTH